MADIEQKALGPFSAEQRAEFVEAFRELATKTGVDGVPRLVALFSKRNGDVGLSQATLTNLAREALQTKASKQILQFPQESTSGGAVHATHKNHVWQADTASMFTFGGGYFIIAVDVFTRFTRAVPTSGTSAAEARRVFLGWPKCEILDTDGGPEWQGVFKEFLQTAGIQHRVKDPKDTNALSVVDRKIQQVKTAISQRWIEEGEKDWKTILPDIISALNETPTEALRGNAPDAIDPVAEFDIQKANALKAEQSQEKQLKQKKKIAETGTLRMRLTRREEEEKQKAGQLGPKRRKFLPTYEGGTKQAQVDDEGKAIFYSGKGQDEHGSMINLGSEAQPKMIPVSHVTPVAKASASVRIPEKLLGGVKLEDAKKTRLAEAVNLLVTHLREVQQMTWRHPMPPRRNPRTVVSDFLRGKPGVQLTDLTPQGWRFFQKHYADRMTVTPGRADGRPVIFFRPVAVPEEISKDDDGGTALNELRDEARQRLGGGEAAPPPPPPPPPPAPPARRSVMELPSFMQRAVERIEDAKIVTAQIGPRRPR